MMHPNDNIDVYSVHIEKMAEWLSEIKATTTLQSSQGAEFPRSAPTTEATSAVRHPSAEFADGAGSVLHSFSRPVHHCIGLCDPERHGPFETELDYYLAEEL